MSKPSVSIHPAELDVSINNEALCVLRYCKFHGQIIGLFHVVRPLGSLSLS